LIDSCETIFAAMQLPVSHIIHDQTFWLSTQRAIFWEEEKALIVSDLHFGKTGHFRKSGIAVPQSVYKEDLQRFFDLVTFYATEKVIIVGDMFHSAANKEMEWFERWRKDVNAEFILIKGNHDILKDDWYLRNEIQLHTKSWTLNNISFTHDQETVEHEKELHYTFTGHIHPGVEISGLGKQYLRFPCYYFCEKFAVLPAFSHFTGLSMIQPCDSDNIFAILPAEKNKNSGGSIMKMTHFN
jgi:DNA ligase-associated metallophosphoesterase